MMMYLADFLLGSGLCDLARLVLLLTPWTTLFFESSGD